MIHRTPGRPRATAVPTLAGLLAVLLACLPASPAAAGDDLHRWVDGDGKVHISDRPGPPGTKDTVRSTGTTGTTGRSPARTSKRGAGPARFTHGLLWRIEPGSASGAAGATATAPSYVFGTMHSADPRVTRLAPEVERAFGASTSVCGEANLDGDALMAVGQRMFAEEGKTLDSVLGAELFAKVAPLMEQRGLPAPFLPMLKPWVVLLALGMPASATTDSGVVLDLELMQRAEAAGKKVCGLETLDEQIDAVEKISERDQVAQIRTAAATAGKLEGIYAKAIDLYVAGDLAGLSSLDDDGSGSDAALTKNLIDDRNVRMAERIASRAAPGGLFAAIGAAHLSGDGGVLALLERRGFSVTRVDPTPEAEAAPEAAPDAAPAPAPAPSADPEQPPANP